MKNTLLALLAAVTATWAQVQPVPALPAPPPPALPSAIPARPTPVRGLRPPEPDRSALSKTNYRIRVEIKEGKDAPMEMSVVTSEGKIRTQMVNPKKVVIDEREVPSTMDLTATLNPLEEDKCQLTLFLGRTMPYVTGRMPGPGGNVSQYQQMQLGLETTVVLQVGKPLLIQSDPTQQIKVTLEKATE